MIQQKFNGQWYENNYAIFYDAEYPLFIQQKHWNKNKQRKIFKCERYTQKIKQIERSSSYNNTECQAT